ncbi:MAG: 4Fe-4S dicluster domain-containing protein [Saprospiraceae bacterium]|nr:4Fe-4S dicluster domain-containing protein [Saprospiraceae bacterium]
MKQQDKNYTRRTFLNKSAKSFVAAATGGGLLSTLEQCQNSKSGGEKIKLLSTDGELVEVDSSSIKKIVPDVVESKHKVREGIPGKKWVMVFDLAKCKGAGKCLSACSKMHYLPPHRSYIKVLKMQDADLSSPYWMPMPCFHCDQPPCVKACPVDATFKLTDGIVGIDNERCIGCRFCMVACPYSARTFNWSEADFELTTGQLAEITPHELCSTHKTGTVEKCDFCPHNLVKGLLPDCVTSCPYGAIYFGNEYDDAVSNGQDTVKLSELLKDKAAYRYLEEFGTKPRVYYLPPVDRLFPFEERELDLSDYL